mmetsp:Transcript_7061/g.12604  ORF Transcript_7061/g.12604 Transcript_7061/m.12604 type:complete len:246 (-) Transcript_7061:471-1208(-)
MMTKYLAQLAVKHAIHTAPMQSPTPPKQASLPDENGSSSKSSPKASAPAKAVNHCMMELYASIVSSSFPRFIRITGPTAQATKKRPMLTASDAPLLSYLCPTAMIHMDFVDMNSSMAINMEKTIWTVDHPILRTFTSAAFSTYSVSMKMVNWPISSNADDVATLSCSDLFRAKVLDKSIFAFLAASMAFFVASETTPSPKASFGVSSGISSSGPRSSSLWPSMFDLAMMYCRPPYMRSCKDSAKA